MLSNKPGKLTSNQRRVRVRFAYSFDSDRVVPVTQTDVNKTESCFAINAIDDQLIKQGILSERDSLEKDDFLQMNVSYR